MISIGFSDNCAHCGQPALGFASHNDDRLCHDDVRDCYELVTVYRHPMPCACNREQP